MHPKRTMPKKFSIWYSHRITRRRKLWSQAKSRSTRQRCFAIDPDRMPFIIVSNFDKNRGEPTTALTRTLAASERID
jgi:hypothetical protein